MRAEAYLAGDAIIPAGFLWLPTGACSLKSRLKECIRIWRGRFPVSSF